ncbi:MAG TPA: Gfo/Idh/MocA family oxidoreductase, partial [Opitutaceae bacterium]|nr:Gfo/Idh/MocA family oxidoreductase [Opitutaceae bacterium]
MKKLRLGLVGTGFIAPFHLRGFAQNPHAAITGICALSDFARRDRLAAEFGLRAFDTFEQLAAD